MDMFCPNTANKGILGQFNGYGMEDSNIMNKTSIEKGLFRTQALKKYQTEIEIKQNNIDFLSDNDYKKICIEI